MELLFSRKMADRLPKRPQSPFRGSQAYFKDFSWGIQFFLSGQRIGRHIGSVSWNIQHILWLISSINFYHVECGDGRQPRILIDNFWLPRSKTRRCFTPGFQADMAEPWNNFAIFAFCFFFFCLFSFQGQNNFISLMDIHVQHLVSLCRICGDKIKDHKRKVDTINSFVCEIHQI